MNDCIAYCAVGHVHSYPVLVVLWGNAALRGHPGTQRYTKVTLLYPGPRPNALNGHSPATVTRTAWRGLPDRSVSLAGEPS